MQLVGMPSASTATAVPTGTIVTIAVVTALVVAMILAMAYGGARVNLTVDGDTLYVRPRGLDVLWCLSTGVRIPVDSIQSASVRPRSALPRRRLKLPGSNLPGIITAGSYGSGDNRTFWDVRRADTVMVITCAAGSPYRQVVIEVDDPQATAARLRTQLAPR